MKIEIKERTYALELKRLADSNAGQIFLYENGQSVSFGEYEKRVVELACRLRKMGLHPGEHVALWAYNSIAWEVAYCAIIRAGGVAVLINYGVSASSAAKLFRAADVSMVLWGPNKAVIRSADGIFTAVSEAAVSSEKVINIEQISDIPLVEKDLEEIYALDRADDPRRSAVIIFTSGSTEEPKAVMLSQYAMLNNVSFLNHSTVFEKPRKMLLAIPQYHSYGMAIFNAALVCGCTLYLESRLIASILLDTIERYQIETVFSVNAIYSGIIGLGTFSSAKVSSVVLCMMAGGFTAPIQMYQFETAFKNAVFMNGYGQTETSPGISFPRESDSMEVRATTVGHINDYLDVRIVDKAGVPLVTGEIGEIIVKGYNISNGYYKFPAEQQPFDKDGWLHTGDLGYLDERGCLVISGRLKDIIIRCGENIVPAEVEKTIMQYPGVKAVKIYGANNVRFGESVECCIVPGDRASFNEMDLRKFLRARLTSAQIPEHFFLYDVFPLLENGKVDQKALKLSMMSRLWKTNIKASLDRGNVILSMSTKNSEIMVKSCLSAISYLVEALGLPKEKALKISLVSEQVLNGRIQKNKENSGDILIEASLMNNWLRITFCDNGKPFDFAREVKMSRNAKLIQNAADNIERLPRGKYKSAIALDFVYENGIDVSEFLSSNDIVK